MNRLQPFAFALALLAIPSMAQADTTAHSAKKSNAPKLYVRTTVLYMAPNVSSDEVVLSNNTSFAELAIEDGPIPGSGVGVDSVTIPAILLGYVLPYMDGKLSIETVLGAPVSLSLKATGTLANESIAPFALGNVPTGVPAFGEDLGTAKALPPIVTAVYRFAPWNRVRPYAGAGIAYMHIYDTKVTNAVLNEVTEPTLDVSDGVGLVAQGGLETRITGRYFATLDVKAILGMSMTATVSNIYVRTPELPVFEMTEAGNAVVDIGMTPLLVSAGLGAEF